MRRNRNFPGGIVASISGKARDLGNDRGYRVVTRWVVVGLGWGFIWDLWNWLCGGWFLPELKNTELSGVR